ncbi:hypothetical protein HYDPIDRAFT_109928 [Hydnomerulius pinastri MD-312]|nr:hypothetical protein HYDPIDRAFT_109928 [Hydnomerulius pinastri MD-312]
MERLTTQFFCGRRLPLHCSDWEALVTINIETPEILFPAVSLPLTYSIFGAHLAVLGATALVVNARVSYSRGQN